MDGADGAADARVDGDADSACGRRGRAGRRGRVGGAGGAYQRSGCPRRRRRERACACVRAWVRARVVEKGSLGGWGIAQQAVQAGVNAHEGHGSCSGGKGELEYIVGGVGGRGRE
jgi:hypothetical protein